MEKTRELTVLAHSFPTGTNTLFIRHSIKCLPSDTLNFVPLTALLDGCLTQLMWLPGISMKGNYVETEEDMAIYVASLFPSGFPSLLNGTGLPGKATKKI
ncbi:uncharacterized protein LOC120889315 isoform X2 [Ictidomys tridecemlineatus]